MGFLLCDHGLDFEIGLSENSINQSNITYRDLCHYRATEGGMTFMLQYTYYHVMPYVIVCFQTFSVLCPRNWWDLYTVTNLNLAKLTKEQSTTYQIRLWSQEGTKVNRAHHGDILLRSPPWFGIETKNQIVSYTNPATIWSLCIWNVTQRRNIRQANRELLVLVLVFIILTYVD